MTSMVVFCTALFVLLSAAYAHVSITPKEVPAGKSSIIQLRVSHDCGDETIGTTNFTVVLPSKMARVTVELDTAWNILIHKHAQDEDYVQSVTFLGFLPDGFYKLFAMRIRFPDEVGQKLYFRSYQDCHNQGTSLAWDEIPCDHNPDPRYPAPHVTVVNATESGH
ncbi:hypothetical protein BWQ96_10353 [Gracilariopsis chorda]|uniref:YncI copper-binding domain-containing protein n=1 Tax=Gracilariopsis chorda TaxID=448386 RepID=A0A2V3ICW4_9FLOR|nr:hypothetical protein BWQ96_10353 [Gracilariopsis chorda]|eukprot:PXF39935.1 hypothetical protein BWQ96_10353 [Gracilariopsis chorda]